MADISPDVVILTRAELQERESKAFQRGVERGRFEAASDRSRTSEKVARNCAHWIGGRCETCGVQWQDHEVGADYACPHFETRNGLRR